MERKGQGAIEYLLIIGAAILVVAIVIVAITSVVSVGKPNGMPEEQKQNNTLKCNANPASILVTGGTPCTLSGTGLVTNAAACDCCNNTYADANKVVGLVANVNTMICLGLPVQ